MTDRWTEGTLFDLLRVKYPKEQTALLPQVRSGAGFDARRTADAIAMNLWPSRGLTLEGFEIKVSRSDWLRELQDPSKADVIYGFCNHWWIVAPRDVVKKEELPETWGLYEVNKKGDSLRAVVKAPKNKEAKEPSRSFLAALLKRLAAVETPEAALEEARTAGYKEGVNSKQDNASWQHKQVEKAHFDLLEIVREFEEKSGLSIRGWQRGKIGDTVRLLEEMGGPEEAVKSVIVRLEHVQGNIKKALTELKENA